MSRRILPASLIAALAVATVATAPAAQAAAPTDPQAAGQQPLAILRVPQALDALARPLQDVSVLVADTGLDLDHPDIAARLFALPAAVPAPNPDGLADPGTVQAGRAGWDLIGTTHHGALHPDDDPSDPEGWSGNGTQVAGVLGAAWNNGTGGAGVAPNARFVALRTCWDGDECQQYVQASAIDWAAARGAKVVNLGWIARPLEESLRAAIARHPEMLFVTIPSSVRSSGVRAPVDADGEDPQPCGLDLGNVLCVSTSAPDDGLDCGAFGPRSVDVAVPTRGNVTTTNGGGFGATDCSTALAAPAAAGVATILYGIDPGAPAAEVRAAILDSARRVPAWAGKSTTGGVVDAAAAVTLFQQRRGIARDPGAPPVAAPTNPTPGPVVPRATTPKPDRRPPSLSVIRQPGSRRIAIEVDESVTLSIVLERQMNGRRSFGKCRPQNAGNISKPRCVSWIVQTTVMRRAAVKTRFLKFSPRAVLRRKFVAGAVYRLSITASDAAGNRSRLQRVVLG